MNKISKYSKQKGSTTVLIIMFVLLMVCIAVLSISQTHSSYKLSKKMSTQIANYYKLESDVAHFTTELISIIKQSKLSADSKGLSEIVSARIDEISGRFDNLKITYELKSVDGFQISYDIWNKSDNGFRVTLLLSDDEFTVLKWQALTKEFEESKPKYEDMKNAD